MIVVRLMGGLGNQLFQYALGRRLALLWGVDVKLDASQFQHDPKRSYELGAFNINASFASQREIDELVASKTPRLRYEWYKSINKLRPWHRRRHLVERTLEFDADVLRAGPHVYLDGYWQSPLYFESIDQILRKEFSPRSPVVPDVRDYPGDTICVHVRRGDYAYDEHTRQVHGMCPVTYYEAAIADILVRATSPIIFVFSDDVDWVRANLRFPVDTVFMPPGSSHADLVAMSECKYFVIANSSYSWWAAWLSRVDPGHIYAPRVWGIDRRLNTLSRFPKGWNLL